MVERFLLICAGGAVGTGLRYLTAGLAARWLGPDFPYGTLIVNLVGCFVITAAMEAALTLGWSPTLRSALTIGFVGGLTTYSSFNYETALLATGTRDVVGRPATAALYLGVTLIGCILFGLAGLWAARRFA